VEELMESVMRLPEEEKKLGAVLSQYTLAAIL
jgi:hypothetical protein